MSAPLVIVNPAASGGAARSRWRRIAPHLRRHLPDAEVRFTERRGHASALARRAAEEGRELVVACGGDGTISEVTHGLIEAGGGERSPIPLGIIPGGTGGDTVRTLGIPSDPEAAMERIARGGVDEIDAAEVRFRRPDGGEGRRYWLNVADAGLGGETVAQVERFKGLGGRLAYLVGSIASMWRYETKTIAVEGEGLDPFTVDATVVAVANGRFFGAGMEVAPSADPRDGWLDLVVLPRRSIPAALFAMRRLYDGSLEKDPDVRTHRVRRVSLRGVNCGPVLLDVDGEQPGELPATFTVLPRALPLRA